MEIYNTGLYNISYFFDYTFRLEEKMAVKYVFVTGGVVSGLRKRNHCRIFRQTA